jgi:hypothetical protein
MLGNIIGKNSNLPTKKVISYCINLISVKSSKESRPKHSNILGALETDTSFPTFQTKRNDIQSEHIL